MSPNRIGIITIHKVNNYGAELQAFALQEKLNRIGHEAEIIDYLFYKHKDFKHTRRSKPFVSIGIKRQLKEFFIPMLSQLKSLPHKAESIRRDQAFERFRNQHVRYSKKTYFSMDALYESIMDYDIFMVGSDQVWNPFCNVSLSPYFLDFAPQGKPKLSYASSFGVSEIPVDAKPFYRDYLNQFDQIAVREEQGVSIVSDLTGRKAAHVVDPTLLLDEKEWREVSLPVKVEEPYLLLYVLTESKYATEIAKKVATHLNLKIVRICKNAAKEDWDRSILNIIDAGPSEYISLFLDASFVVTNSFHGTAFSVNFQKPFYTVLPADKPNNSRQEGLLRSVGLERRILPEGTDLSNKEMHQIDFSSAAKLLQHMISHSEQYLLNTIGGAIHA